MKIEDYIVRILKKGYRFLSNKKFESPECDTDRQSANDKIFNLLMSDSSCMIARFGTTEIITINNYLCIHNKESYIKKIWNYISDYTNTPWWYEDHFKDMSIYSGIFPPCKETSEKFAERYLDDIPLIDILGSFQYFEKYMPLRPDVEFVHLETLYPFFVEQPWTRALKGKKILVVHPFESTIQKQFVNRYLLFDNKDVLPEYELITLKSVQSIRGLKVPFKDWFEALKYMEDQISCIDFDICILGCGAYGLPLAAHVKRLGKKAIHLGGGTQLLFGIKGNRWDNPNYGTDYKIPELFTIPYCNLYNEYWIKAPQEETPIDALKVDGGSYW